MMMAHDSTPNRPELSAASVAALKTALEGYLATGHEPASLRPTLRSIATEARGKNMRAEQLLIALKDIWYSLPQIGQASQGEGASQNQMLQQVVTLCIREYYSA